MYKSNNLQRKRALIQALFLLIEYYVLAISYPPYRSCTPFASHDAQGLATLPNVAPHPASIIALDSAENLFKHYVLAISYFPLASIIASTGLNFRVRNENGCDPSDESPEHKVRNFQRVFSCSE